MQASVLRGWTTRRELRAARRSADEQLLASRLASPRLAWRSAELLAPEHRVAVGRSLTDTVHAADERLLPSASPLNRGAIRACRAQLLDLAARIFDLEHSVTPRGMLLAAQLLENSHGPLYGHGEARALRIEAQRVLAVLEDRDE